ncbi:MAG: diguanylate cyclase [Patescibacteria group bacterium]|nr:diguanylate cyclase [Patescibacteria group bacterium]
MEPFYSPTKSYEENYDEGPFGAFADGQVHNEHGEPASEFCGFPVYTPFGIPAGPLLNSKYVRGAFNNGFDIAVYKTVRSDTYPCHPFPNVLAVHPGEKLTLERARSQPLVADTNYDTPVSITNSFGVPSKMAVEWQADFKKADAYAKKGQVAVLSFMGTVREGQTQDEFIDDYVKAGTLANATGAKVLEMNLSCPNIGNEGLVCYNLDVTKEICARLRPAIGATPLILKVGYYEDDAALERLAQIAEGFADGIAAINTLQATIVDEKGEQALPGKNRSRSGVCGASIKWAGLEMTEKLNAIRKREGMHWTLIGVGGVTTPSDYFEYRAAGADVVMSATGAMWNPHLAIDIKKEEDTTH